MCGNVSDDLKFQMIDSYAKDSNNIAMVINEIHNIEELKNFCDDYGIKLAIHDENDKKVYERCGKKFSDESETDKDKNFRLKHKPLYCSCDGNEYITLSNDSLKRLTPISNDRISSYKKRDIEKNEKTVLLNELTQNKEKYKDFIIVFHNASKIKYQYLIEKLDKRRIEDLTIEDIDLIRYLLMNFGLYINLVHDDIVINKEDIDETFLDKYKKYAIKNIVYDGFLKKYVVLKIESEKKYVTSHPGQHVRMDKIISNDMLQRVIKNTDKIILFKITDHNEHILNTNYISTNNTITKDDLFELSKAMICCECKCYLDVLEKGTYTIDAINPLLGHTKNNCCLMCRNCNSFKNVQYLGKYHEKPYYYDISQMELNELNRILKWHYEDIEFCHETRIWCTRISFYKLYRSINSKKNDRNFLAEKLRQCIELIDDKEGLMNKLRECPILSKSFKKQKLDFNVGTNGMEKY
jgi:hypothetical protein